MTRALAATEKPAPAEAFTRARRSAPRGILIELGLLAFVALLVPAREIWAVQALLFGLLLVAPGAVLLRALRVPGDAISAFPVYVPCASIVVLCFAGLGVDLLGPSLGVAQPLRVVPLLVGVEAACLVLLAVGATTRRQSGVRWAVPGISPRHAWPLLIPVAAAVGSARLTNGHGPAVAIVAIAVAAGALLVVALSAQRLSGPHLSVVLYGVGLALAWSFTLRGHFLYGFDISGEFHTFEQTLSAGVWKTSHRHDAYGAMLSLTVLPSTLHALTGISALDVLKIAYPMLFALFPVALFRVGSRVLSHRWAFIAAAFVVVQNYFFQQMPAIARQEIGLVLFVALVMAILDRRMPRRVQWRLVAVLGVGVVVSHYSTAYLAIAVFGLAVILQVLVSAVRRMRAVYAPLAVAFVVMAAGAGVWYAGVTHSTSNVSTVLGSFQENGVSLLPNARPGQNVVEAYLSGNAPTRASALAYQRDVAREYAKDKPYVKALAAAKDPKYALRGSTLSADAIRSPEAYNALRVGQVVVDQLANILVAIAALVLVLRRRSSSVARLIGLLGLSTLLVLAFLRLSGTAANAYNQERAFVQTMVPLAIGGAWLLQGVARRSKHLNTGLPVAAVVALGVVLVGTSGLRGVAAGGGTTENVANKGEDFERFYVIPPELSAARWINAAAPRSALIYTDRYGQLRVLAATGRAKGPLFDLTPRTLDQHAWVYATRTNLVDQRARGETGSRYAIYAWPERFLADYWNTVYTTGTSAVYQR